MAFEQADIKSARTASLGNNSRRLGAPKDATNDWRCARNGSRFNHYIRLSVENNDIHGVKWKVSGYNRD